MEPHEAIADRYRRFAAEEARGSSPTYEQLALAAAGSPRVLQFLATLPKERQQPNLFLAAIRLCAGTPSGSQSLESALGQHEQSIRQVMLTRTTQTNEAARCAVLLPVLARLEGPLALIEVGASAGLCLWPDRYAYQYGQTRLAPVSDATPAPPVLECEASENTPLPQKLPSVAWRRGIDLNPLDVHSDGDTEWLEALIWPEHAARRERLRSAIAMAQQEQTPVHKGDLLRDLPKLASHAPKDAKLLVFHSAVLGYIPGQRARDRFVDTVRETGATWISNEVPRVYPWIAAKAGNAPKPGMSLLAVDGEPVAWTDPHGRSIHWL